MRLDGRNIDHFKRSAGDKILEMFDITNTASTPAYVPISPRVEKEERTKEDVPYREMVGSLVWLATNTRPDTADAVGTVARHSYHPTAEDWPKVLRILAYVNGGQEVGITYERSASNGLVAYADSDNANSSDRKSVSGGALIFGAAVL